ncbi:MAG: hypothetical protein R2815_10750 [Flavobacteriales bacterium]|nr:hypothetical protein [Flavobacteriales bacterium]
MRSISILYLATLSTLSQAQTTPIGAWQDHLPYRKAVAVEVGGGAVYCAATSGLFRYDPGAGEFDRLTKVNVLSDVDIQGIEWNDPLSTLLVFYSNGNLDLVKGDVGYNMGDIKRSSLLGDKAIYSAHFEGTTAYLGCGFGIVKVDLERREVRETWFIGPSGSQVRVNDIAFYGDSIYAATQNGLYVAWQGAANLAAFDNWRKRQDMGGGMANGPFNAVSKFGDRLLLNFRGSTPDADTLLILDAGNAFQHFEPLYGRQTENLNVSADGQLLIAPHRYDIHRYDLDMNELARQYGYNGQGVFAEQAVQGPDGAMWVADRGQGLVRGEGFDTGTSIIPNGPRNASAFRMDSHGGALYVSTGGVEGNWASKFLKDGVHNYVDGTWVSVDPDNNTIMQGVNAFAGAVNDVMVVAVDPRDPDHAFAGSWDEGLIEFRGRLPQTIYNSTNSALQAELNGAPGKVNVAGLDYDRDGNLWITNAFSNNPIVVYTKDGAWQGFDPGSILNGVYLVSDILAARNGYKWIIRPRGNALLVFDDGGTITNTSDDRYKLLNNIPGTGGLPSQDVYCIAEDLDQQVWVGTNKGVAVFYTPEAIFNSDDYDAQQILIEQDGNVQILLETEAISAIQVDGANRKWIGTQTSGAFLISADGQEQIQHFTAENSPLPSNNITSLAIDELTGEVFFGTDRGIFSYRGDAIDGADDSECVKVFPNPVHPSYTGPVAITGLVVNSEVKITDVSGNLVYRTTSLGGQAIWNGNDMSGNRVSTGVYLVFASDRSGTYKCNTKVLVTR